MKTVILSHIITMLVLVVIVIFVALCGTVHAQEAQQCIAPTEPGLPMSLAETADTLSRDLLTMRVYRWPTATGTPECDVQKSCTPLAKRYFWIVPYQVCDSSSGCRIEVVPSPLPDTFQWYPANTVLLWLLIDPNTCICSILSYKPLFTSWLTSNDPDLSTPLF